MNGVLWKGKREATLRLMWPWVPMRELSRVLGVSPRAISCKVQRMGLGPRPRARPWQRQGECRRGDHPYRLWSDADDALLVRTWPVRDVAMIARDLGTTASAVRNRAWQLNLPPRMRHWTTRERELVATRYGPLTAIQLSVLIGRDEHSIRQHVCRMRKLQTQQAAA